MLQSRNRGNLHSHFGQLATLLGGQLALQSRNRGNLHSHAILQRWKRYMVKRVAIPQSGKPPFTHLGQGDCLITAMHVAIPQSGKPPFTLRDFLLCCAVTYMLQSRNRGNLHSHRMYINASSSACVRCNPAIGETSIHTAWQRASLRQLRRLQSRNRGNLHSHPSTQEIIKKSKETLQSRNRGNLHSHLQDVLTRLDKAYKLQSRNRGNLHSHIVNAVITTSRRRVAIPQSGKPPFTPASASTT